MGPRGAVYFETLTTTSRQISKEDWDNLRIGMACTSTFNLMELKRELEKLCSATACSYEGIK